MTISQRTYKSSQWCLLLTFPPPKEISSSSSSLTEFVSSPYIFSVLFFLTQKIKAPQPCAMCRASRSMADMLENKTGEDAVELFCSSSCVMAFKIQAMSASGASLNLSLSLSLNIYASPP